MLIVIYDTNELRAKLWATSLIDELGCQVHITKRIDSAIGYIETFPTLDLIIAPTENANYDVSAILTNKVRSLSKSLKILYYGKTTPTGDHVFHLKREPLVAALIKTVSQLLGKSVLNQQYVPIPSQLLKSVENLSCDVFLKLSKDSFENMILFFKRNNLLEESDFKRLDEKKYTELWIKQENKTIFLNKVLERINKDLSTEDEESILDATQTEIKCKNFIYNAVELIGISNERAESILDSIEKMNKESKQLHELKNILNNNIYKKFSFKNIHPITTALIATNYLLKQTWHTQGQLEAIVIASHLMDLDLDKDEFVLIRNQLEFDSGDLNRGDKFKIINHANTAASKIEKMPKISSTVINLVRTHHGSLNGIGYQEGPVQKLDRLTLLFMAAEELSCFLFRYKNTAWTFEKFIEEMEGRFIDVKYLKNLLGVSL